MFGCFFFEQSFHYFIAEDETIVVNYTYAREFQFITGATKSSYKLKSYHRSISFLKSIWV